MPIARLLIPLLFLAACVSEPVVSDFNGDSVTVQSQTAGNSTEVAAEAERLCRTRGRTAEYASSRQIYAPQEFLATYAHLFICSDSLR